MCELVAIARLYLNCTSRNIVHHFFLHKRYCICFNSDVSVPEETIWELQPHTEAKHQILRRYLDAWFPILAKYNSRIVYVDGFSGPGRYSGGEPGSPIIALESARTHRANLAGELVFLFVEERQDRIDNLNREISKIQLPAHFKVDVECGTFAKNLTAKLNKLDADGHQIAPTFALIDPFGFSGIPYNLISRLLSKKKCEVLITFVVDAINRWLTLPDPQIRSHIIETFGTDAAIAIAEGTDRRAQLKNLYQQQLTKVAQFVRYFEMRDANDRVVYYLFFASNSSLGHLKMKEAMWKVDPLGDFRFSDSTNPNQQVLFSNPSVEPLVTDLDSNFRGAAQIPAGQVETYVQDKTPYLRKHMKEAFTQLESDGRLKVAELKTDGKRRRSGTYPNTALLSFQ
jgi:three-Cys-motif partner protein